MVHVVVDRSYFIRERPFFANKNVTFAKLLQTPCFSFAEPMLGKDAMRAHKSHAKMRQTVMDHALIVLHPIASRNRV